MRRLAVLRRTRCFLQCDSTLHASVGPPAVVSNMSISCFAPQVTAAAAAAVSPMAYVGDRLVDSSDLAQQQTGPQACATAVCFWSHVHLRSWHGVRCSVCFDWGDCKLQGSVAV